MGGGRLRVLLGAAPGVGKTYSMLEEGHQLRATGQDVVVAVLETHGRAATAALADGLELAPRRIVSYKDVELDEMDLDAVIARRPDVALVDELAHTNAPGSRNAKRWQDVQELLDAGISVISTVNIQHIESLNDVVQTITGVPQRETIPDAVLRSADQVELVDLAPQALRNRLGAGYVYPAERIDAALANYFRLGNLTALRELALLWLADDVEQALRAYRAEQGIQGVWETRERVVVSLPGGPEGEALLRRGARIAARSGGGELLAVHVTAQDGLRAANPVALTEQRRLVEELGGTFHQVVGEDIPAALIEFAQGVNATQLVIGASRRGRLAAALTPGIGSTVIRQSGPIDVHVVSFNGGRDGFALPRVGGALSRRRQVAGFVLALTAGPLLTAILVAVRGEASLTSDVLFFQLLVVIVALVGGLWPASFAAVMSGLTINFLFIEPRLTIAIDQPRELFALVLYVVIAVLVSVVVDRGARQARVAKRAAAEAELLAVVSSSVLRGEKAAQVIVERIREAFGLAGVRLTTGDRVIARSGEPLADDRHSTEPVGSRATLELHGPAMKASERRLLAVLIAQLDAVLERNELSSVASEIEPLAATDRVRSALLSALSHDVRRPLATATAAVGGLREADTRLTEEDKDILLSTAEDALETLGRLTTDLLDVSRIQAGAIGVALVTVDPADCIAQALDELGLGPADVSLDLDRTVDGVTADPVLLQRVLVNLLANAVRYSPRDHPVHIATSAFGTRAQIRVIDRGPGIPSDKRDDAFLPFQRHGDTDNTAGLGLGLALSRGFVEGMGGTLVAEDTPGGGLTMVVDLAIDGATVRDTRGAGDS